MMGEITAAAMAGRGGGGRGNLNFGKEIHGVLVRRRPAAAAQLIMEAKGRAVAVAVAGRRQYRQLAAMTTTTTPTKLFQSQPPTRFRIGRVRSQGPPPSTYSSRISTDIPLYETPGASFDQYLEDTPRVFRAIFPDKRRSQQLTQEEWRVHMLPINFLFLTVFPVVDMRLRCKTNGEQYPLGIPPETSKVLELDIIRWELQGLDDVMKPTHFGLGVKGALYTDRRGVRTRLKGQLEMKLSIIVPPMLALVPEDVLRSVSESVLKRLVENMNEKVNSTLLADYGAFRRERQMNPV